ncbi:uncharacterized protein LOC129949414 [Eupeodes corollae]|uniref:uncharacterized protein LOC129949414 n=1 Tax=Eupeodes corollae TaxID=290404 RepID=UPI00248FA809|nr:uncharacterized protein LOC129949414 [Eupeodes corollae]XP_055916835.1 uncharacterized protein LOC129949414 [Eupeodes corollae]
MPFQRSYSKVWWGSDNLLPTTANNGNFHLSNQQNSGYSSLDYHLIRSNAGNLSRIQEVEDENSSKLWAKHESPGSLRSQDSGFSDNDESQSIGGGRRRRTSLSSSSPRSAKSDLSENNGSPTSMRTIETPPTVIRRPKMSLNVTPNRLSFSAPNSPCVERKKDIADDNGNTDDTCDLISKLNRISFVNTTPKRHDGNDGDSSSSCKCSPITTDKLSSSVASVSSTSSIRRRRLVSRKTRRSLMPTNAPLDASPSRFLEYNNETVVLGGAMEEEEDANNNTLHSEGDVVISPLKAKSGVHFTASTSTPKLKKPSASIKYGSTLPSMGIEYDNPLLNGHPPALQSWLDDIRMSYDREVMSTLQTKSIVLEAFKNMKITSNTVAKIIRQLQQRSVAMQADFDIMEKILKGNTSASLHVALSRAHELLESVDGFTLALERRSVFFAEFRADRKRFEENIEHIKLIVKDTRISLEKHHYIQMESLHDDIQVLKRYLLITLRLVYEKLVRVIVHSVEQSKCDLMLRANINMIATLSNMQYEGFASLSDAFVQNEAVRALLMICLENKLSSVRALALRALAAICCSPEAISQFNQAGGLEIVRDILQKDGEKEVSKKTDAEKREAVSLLTQITAPWHGGQCRVEGLKDSAEILVEGISDLIERTNCCPTLLLCAASLNNLSRVEMTSVYSIMSNETIIKLKDTLECRGLSGISIFLYEQIVAMLHNMSSNKKCHSHLANSSIINFITSIFQTEFYRKYSSRAEVDAQRRTIKAILHTLARLIHESSLGHEILEQNFIPIFSKVGVLESTDEDYGRDISALARQLNESCANKSFNRSQESRGSTTSSSSTLALPLSASGMKFNLTRQESYV